MWGGEGGSHDRVSLAIGQSNPNPTPHTGAQLAPMRALALDSLWHPQPWHPLTLTLTLTRHVLRHPSSGGGALESSFKL